MNAKVSIIILNYMSYKDTLSFIKHIRRALAYDNYNIIVVENNSPNESFFELKKMSKKYDYTVLKSELNGGYASGNNIGIRYSYTIGAEYSWILNNDIILKNSHILSNMVSLMKSNKNIGVVSPVVFKPDGTEDFPVIKRPNIWDMTFGCFYYAKSRKKKLRRDSRIYRPQGCCMLLRNSDMKKIGELDEKTFLYCEEDILAERLLGIDRECWLSTASRVIHNHSKTVYSVMKRKQIAQYNCNSYEVYIRKYRRISNKLLVRVICLFKYLIIYFSY